MTDYIGLIVEVPRSGRTAAERRVVEVVRRCARAGHPALRLCEPVAVDDEVGACEVRPGTLDDVDAAAAVLAEACPIRRGLVGPSIPSATSNASGRCNSW